MRMKQIEIVEASQIQEYKRNAKRHPKKQIEQIKKSIQEFGFNDPIAIDENNVIIEGHGRFKALQELGYEEIECIRLTHLTEEQKKAYILAHNKLNMETGFDTELLIEEIDSIIDFDMSDFGFNMDKNSSRKALSERNCALRAFGNFEPSAEKIANIFDTLNSSAAFKMSLFA